MPSTDAGELRVPHAAAIYLAVVQFFFVTTWTVYVIYLPQLAAAVGVRKDLVIWILMFDQLVFAIMDFALGQAADKVRRTMGRIGPAILAITVVSCIAFLLLPHTAGMSGHGLLATQIAAAVLLLLWTATSSALRAPPWVLLSKYAASPRFPWLSALMLTGLALGGAIAPYLGVTLRKLDPRLPFALASLSLLVTTAGLIWVERHLQRVGSGLPATVDAAHVPRRLDRPTLAFFLACAVLALGFQVHSALNSSAQYLRFAKPADLEYLLPIFWIGFNVLMFPGAALAKRWGALPVMAGAALLGMAGALTSALSGSLEVLIAGQLLAGGAWGCIMMASFSVVTRLGHSGREGFMLGLLWSVLATATLARMALSAAQLTRSPDVAAVLSWLPGGLWLAGGLLAFALWRALPSGRRVA